MEAWDGTDPWAVAGAVAGIIGAVVAVVAVLSAYYPIVRSELDEDPVYRREKAEALKNPHPQGNRSNPG